MAPHTPSYIARHAGLKLFPYSTSPGSDRHVKALISKAGTRAGQLQPASGINMHSIDTGRNTAGRTTAAAVPDSASTAEQVDPETTRLMTAATILSASDSGSACDTPVDSTDDDSTLEDIMNPLSVLDDLTALDADSLSLAVGILRQHQPIDADEADVQLSERLRDLLVLLRQRPGKASAASTSAFGMQRVASPVSHLDGAEAAAADAGFWARPDEWSDVRAALMSIGINASVDEEDDESVWTVEEEGIARRTRLLKSLPRLDADTAAELAAFLAGLRQRSDAGTQAARSSGNDSINGSDGSRLFADDQVEVEEGEEHWWGEVTQAYQKLWQQAQLQQARPATERVV